MLALLTFFLVIRVAAQQIIINGQTNSQPYAVDSLLTVYWSSPPASEDDSSIPEEADMWFMSWASDKIAFMIRAGFNPTKDLTFNWTINVPNPVNPASDGYNLFVLRVRQAQSSPVADPNNNGWEVNSGSIQLTGLTVSATSPSVGSPIAATPVASSASSALPSVSKSASLTTESASTSPSTADIASTPATPVSQGAPSKSKTGAIAGGVVGGLTGLVLMGGLVLFLLKRRQRGDNNRDIQPVRKQDEKAGTVDGKFVPHETARPADAELSEWVGRSA